MLALCIQIARKLHHVYSPDIPSLQLLAIKMPSCTHTGRFISVLLCSGQYELVSICLFVQFNPIAYRGGGGGAF